MGTKKSENPLLACGKCNSIGMECPCEKCGFENMTPLKAGDYVELVISEETVGAVVVIPSPEESGEELGPAESVDPEEAKKYVFRYPALSSRDEIILESGFQG